MNDGEQFAQEAEQFELEQRTLAAFKEAYGMGKCDGYSEGYKHGKEKGFIFALIVMFPLLCIGASAIVLSFLS